MASTASIVELKDKLGNILLPNTVGEAVLIGNKTLVEYLETFTPNTSTNNSSIDNTSSNIIIQPVNIDYECLLHAYDTSENGLYITDENGNVGLKIDSEGFNAIGINISGNNSSSGESGNNSSIITPTLTIIDY